MNDPQNPALANFLAQLAGSTDFGQVSIQRQGVAFELRHVADVNAADLELREIAPADLRELANFTANGAFRPLKSAPSLPRGWRVFLPDAKLLERALNDLYPGALADWHSAQSGSPPVTGYREFTRRQTGMYRLAQTLPDDRAAQMTRIACAARFCLKRRLWILPGFPADDTRAKSVIPCLEPCALLLEFARVVGRMDKDKSIQLQLSAAEIETLVQALEALESTSMNQMREADFGAPGNPRRTSLLLDQLKPLLVKTTAEPHA